ncbi:hypothetical protein NX059_001416 [Plenodomus lindquistii]|nr:hypothetical protein NX059_001416 [Plenodomus lindquistii]
MVMDVRCDRSRQEHIGKMNGIYVRRLPNTPGETRKDSVKYCVYVYIIPSHAFQNITSELSSSPHRTGPYPTRHDRLKTCTPKRQTNNQGNRQVFRKSQPPPMKCPS